MVSHGGAAEPSLATPTSRALPPARIVANWSVASLKIGPR